MFKQFVLSRKFDAGFGLDLMVKDLGIALGVASETDTTTPYASLCSNCGRRLRRPSDADRTTLRWPASRKSLRGPN